MVLLKTIRVSKRSFYVALLLMLGLLNGLYSQSITVMPTGASHLHSANADVSEQTHNPEHAFHAVVKLSDCGSDAACKTQCAWHCQLSQAMQPVISMLTERVKIANSLPVYYSAIQLNSWLDLKLRPPISS